MGLNFSPSKADWFYFANIITKEACHITLSTMVDIQLLVILNPTIAIILMAKFNSTITTYLVPYIREGYDNKNFCYLVSLLYKVEYNSFTTKGTHALPDICTCAYGITIPNTQTHTHIRDPILNNGSKSHM